MLYVTTPCSAKRGTSIPGRRYSSLQTVDSGLEFTPYRWKCVNISVVIQKSFNFAKILHTELKGFLTKSAKTAQTSTKTSCHLANYKM